MILIKLKAKLLEFNPVVLTMEPTPKLIEKNYIIYIREAMELLQLFSGHHK